MNDASTWTARLAALDLTLPPVATPAGSYLPAVQTGSYVYTSGQLPLVDGTTTCIGKLGEGVSVEDAAQAARLCTLNGLAAVDALVGLDRIVRVVKVVGFVASGSGFSQQPQVINGASDLLAEIFGTAGQHAPLSDRRRRTTPKQCRRGRVRVRGVGQHLIGLPHPEGGGGCQRNRRPSSVRTFRH